MDIIDFTKGATGSKPEKRHHELLTDPLYTAIIGPSGSGKSNLMTNLVLRFTDWGKLIVCCPTDDQSVYDPIREFNELIVQKRLEAADTDEELEALSCKDDPVQFIQSVDEIPGPDQLDGTPTLVVADDVMLEKQDNVARLFCRGRHKNCHAIYLSQSFASSVGRRGGVPPVVRRQLTMLSLFHGIDLKSLRSIFDEYCAGDMNWPEFMSFLQQAAPIVMTSRSWICVNLHSPANIVADLKTFMCRCYSRMFVICSSKLCLRKIARH